MSDGLLLRPWRVDDAEALRAAIDEDVEHLRPWMSWSREEPVDLARTRARLAGFVESFASGASRRFAIVPADAPLVLGGVSLHDRIGPGALELGYWVRRSAAGRGIARAAAARLIVHAFEARRPGRIEIRCDAANLRSAALAERLGFRRLDDLAGSYDDGAPRPLRRYELTEPAYRERSPELEAPSRNVELILPVPPEPHPEKGDGR